MLAAKGLSTRFARKVADAFARSFAGTLRYWESSHLFRRASHFLEFFPIYFSSSESSEVPMPQAFSEFLDVNLGNLYVFPNIFPKFGGHSGSETGSHSTASATTHSRERGDFLAASEWPAIGGLCRGRFGLVGDQFGPRGDFGPVVSSPLNPVSRKRRLLSAETRFECLYCAIKPSI